MAVAPATVTGVNLVAGEARFARLVALVLDSIFVSLVLLIATNVFGVTVVTWGSPVPVDGFASWGSATSIPWVWATAIWLAYYVVCESMFGATPGKALNGLVVVSSDGRPLTVARVLLRNLLRPVDALPGAYLLGGVLVLATADSQRLGDLAAHTTVVRRQRLIMRSLTRSSGRGARVLLAAGVALLVVFTAAFDYFGRPALVVESAYNQHQLVTGETIYRYSLGEPTRTLTTVSYPLTVATASGTCHGTVALQWTGLFGWQVSGATLDCPRSS